MQEIDNTKHLKREILIRLIRAFYKDNDFAKNVRIIPYEMRPKGYAVPYRCCIYKERAILRDRILAGLGFAIEDEDEQNSLSWYAEQSLQRKHPEQNPLTILETACKGCTKNSIYITDLCQCCVARPCVNICKFQAISIINGKSIIDKNKCKKCGMCINVCPYHAIAKTIIPCENSCPVEAITKETNGCTKIDFDKCISCGKCINACPFGAIHEKSQIIDVLKQIKAKANVIAMVAPSIFGQLPYKPGQLHHAIKKLGFSKVYEVAQGADTTAKIEAQELNERLEKGEPFMTTSCCASYNQLIEKHLIELKQYRSNTQTPLFYTAEFVKKENPDAIIVFLSPCVAKRCEIATNPNIDYLLTFEELGALLVAFKIDVSLCVSEEFTYKSSQQGRNFAVSTGVIASIKTACKNNCEHIKPTAINGLNKENIKDLKKYAQAKSCTLGNLIEVMACAGGCVGGNATINPIKMSVKLISNYAKDGDEL